MDGVDIVSGNPITTGDGQSEEVTETTEEVVEEKTEETPKSETQAPLQNLDPIAELEKLTALDPKVKELLKAGYLRQSDYTRKTQEIAQFKKEYDSFVARRKELENTQTVKEEPKPEDFEIPDDPKEFFKLSVKKAKEEALAEFRTLMQQDKEAQAVEAHFNTDIDQAQKLDPRLTGDDAFARQIAGLIQVEYADDIRAGKISVTEATQKVLESHKAYEESLRQKVLTDVNDKAKNRTMVMPKGNGSPLGTAPKTGAKTMREAAALAEEEIGSR